MMLKKLFYSIFIIFFSINLCFGADAQKTNEPLPQNTLYLELKDGVVVIELLPNKAPRHVQRVASLTSDGFYDGLKFHRVIQGFMAQTGDPTGTGRGGSAYGRLNAEFNDEHHVRGAVSMARSSDVNSANSQFFIVTGKFFPDLDKQYTVFGRVIEGMEYVDKIKVGNTSKNGIVDNPDTVVKMLVGNSLNNKPLSIVKQEIALINQLQSEAARENPQYIKKSVLEMLEISKDIDITGEKENTTNTDKKTENNSSNGEVANGENNNGTTKQNGATSTTLPTKKNNNSKSDKSIDDIMSELEKL